MLNNVNSNLENSSASKPEQVLLMSVFSSKGLRVV